MARSSARKMREKLNKAGNGKGSDARPKRVPEFDPREAGRKRRFGGARTARDVGFQ